MSSHPTDATDIQKLTHAVKELDPSPRRDRWGHLSLCILDATFSIGIDYDSMVSPLVRRYGKYAGLSSILISGSDLGGAVGPRSDEQTLTEFLRSISDMSDETLAAQILSNHRTSTRNGILKSAASRQIATCLVKEGIETLSDVSTLLADLGRVQEVEKKLNAVKGSGTQRNQNRIHLDDRRRRLSRQARPARPQLARHCSRAQSHGGGGSEIVVGNGSTAGYHAMGG